VYEAEIKERFKGEKVIYWQSVSCDKKLSIAAGDSVA